MQSELINYILENKEKHYQIAYSYVRNQEDALDIIQDAIVKALKNEGSLKNKEYLGTWFCRILINTCKTHLKKKNKYISIEENIHFESIDTRQDEEQMIEIEEAIGQLPYNEKTIILLRYYEELELKEIASITSQNLSTVKSTLYRTIRKLKNILETH